MVAHVQTASNEGGSGASVAVSITSGGGNTLVLTIGAYVNSNTAVHVSTVSDSHNSWTFSTANSNSNPPVGQSYDGTLLGFSLIGVVIGAIAVSTVTVTFVGGTPSYIDAVVDEFSGVPAGSSIVAASASSTNNNAISNATPSVTVPAGASLAVATMTSDGNAGSGNSVGGSWTMDAGTDHCSAYQVSPSAGSLSATFTSSSAQNWPSSAIAVIGLSGPAASPPYLVRQTVKRASFY